MSDFKIINADVLIGLKSLPSDSVDCVVTSPPYWGLRDYKVEGQIGLEENPKQYVDKIVEIGKEVMRVLKPSGSYWLNIGDSYYSKSGSGTGSNFLENFEKYDGGNGKLKEMHQSVRGKFNDGGWLQPKQRLLIPHRVAIGMQECGWILRNDIIWHKPSCMPSSVQDRLSNTFEYFFHFVKQPKYFYDLDAIRVPYKENSIKRAKSPVNSYDWHSISKKGLDEGQSKTDVAKQNIAELNPLGKNPGDVWDITNNGFKLGHFAVFPKELVRPCIKATCPKDGIVLDIFLGSGTTMEVCQEEKRKAIGIELNPSYVDFVLHRLNGDSKQSSLNPNKIDIVRLF